MDEGWVHLIEPVARQLWGDPPKGFVTKMTIRWGAQGSKKIDLQAGTWFDHEAHEGGGVVDLVMREEQTDKQGAIAWLQAQGFIETRDRENSPYLNRDGRSDPPPPDMPPPEEQPETKLTPVKGYHYTDRDGNLLYDVLRFAVQYADGSPVLDKHGNPRKEFRQRRPDGRGGYIPNLDGITPTIYRHPQVEVAIADGATIYIVEGEKDADTLVDWGLCATTNSGGAKNWTPELAAIFAGADVAILVDNDEVGIEAGEAKALSLRGIASRVRVLNLADHVPGFPVKGDVTDWRDQHGGTADQLLQILQQLPDWTPKPPKSAFNATHIADVEERRRTRRHDWLVQDLIELGGTCSFAGFSQAGKTFSIIELAFCVARGEPFFGRPVKQGLVIYQVGEGELGFEKRLDGYAQDRGLSDRRDVPFIYLPKKINLFVDDKDTDAIIAEGKAWEAYYGIKLQLFVIDTWNKATRGANEISGQDMGKVIDRVERIGAELDCTVIVIDHLNKGGELRGHGSKSMDLTNTIKVITTDKADQNGRKIRRMVLDKNKDGENGTSIPFVLRQVIVDTDEFGRPVTTCVIDPPDGNEEELIATGRLPVNSALVLRAIKDTAEIEGEKAPAELVQVPPGRNVAKWKDVTARLRRTWSFKATDKDEREKELGRVLADAGKRLQLAGFIDRDNERGLIWWTGKEDRPKREPQATEPKATDKPPPLAPDVKEALAEGVPF